MVGSMRSAASKRDCRMRRLVAVLAVLAFSATVPVSWTSPAHADDDGVQRALELHDEARHLYSEGRYQEAIDKLTEAVRLDPDGKVLFYNLGLIQEKVGDLVGALRHYKRALELETDDREKEKLAVTIQRIEGARVTEPAPVPVTSVPEAPAVADQARASEGVTPWVWVAAGTAAAALVTGIVLASRAQAVDPGDQATTKVGVGIEDLERDADKAHQLAIGADVAFVLAGVATAAAVVIAVIDGSGLVASRSAPSVAVGPLGAYATWRF